MSVNDKQLNQGFGGCNSAEDVQRREADRHSGADVYPGSANPTSSSNHANPMRNNFVDDPTTASRGAGAGPNFDGDRQAQRNFSQTAGVVEGRPGIIESTHIDPLSETANKGACTASPPYVVCSQAFHHRRRLGECHADSPDTGWDHQHSEEHRHECSDCRKWHGPGGIRLRDGRRAGEEGGQGSCIREVIEGLYTK